MPHVSFAAGSGLDLVEGVRLREAEARLREAQADLASAREVGGVFVV